MAVLYLIITVSVLVNLSTSALINDAEDLYRNLTNVSESTANVALQELWAESAQIYNSANEVVTNTTPLIQAQIDDVYERYNDVKNYVTVKEIDATTCIDKYEPQLNLTFVNAFVGLTECSNFAVDGAQNFLGHSLGNINNMIEEVFESGRSLTDCGRNNEACLTKIIAKIKYQIVDIPRRMNREKNDAINMAEQMKVSLAACGLFQITLVNLQGGDYVDDFENCVESLIRDKTSTTSLPTTTSPITGSDTSTTINTIQYNKN